ncbi:hypothetical protein A6U86_19810 [Rhizobium sp. AC27/96]|nr:hypothetical protein A6U86_19810 [Rhizobium sp. AC27/96]
MFLNISDCCPPATGEVALVALKINCLPALDLLKILISQIHFSILQMLCAWRFVIGQITGFYEPATLATMAGSVIALVSFVLVEERVKRCEIPRMPPSSIASSGCREAE